MGGFVGKTIGDIGHAFSSVINGIGSAVSSIKDHPLQVIEMAAIAYATGGLGTLAAEAAFAGDAITATAGAGAFSLGSGAANAAAFTAIQTAVPAAIASASVTAINGGSVGQIATSGIIAGVTAGAASGLSSAQIIQNLTTELDPSIVQALTSATGQSIGGAVNAVLQGKDPVTGAVSGAISGALSSALSQTQIADLSQTAAKMLGSTVSAGVNAGIAGKDVGEAIGNSLVYGAAKLGLSDAFNSVSGLQKSLTDTVNNFSSTQDKAKDLSDTVQKNQTDAQSLADKLNSVAKDYDTAKSNYETESAKANPDADYLQKQVDAMTAAAKTYNDTLPNYQSASSLLSDNYNQLQDLTKQLTTLGDSAKEQYTSLQNASTDLSKQYTDFVNNLTNETSITSGIENRVAAMSPEAQAAYQEAIHNGQTATDALAAASKVQAQTVQTAKTDEQPTAQTDTVAQDNTKVASTFTQPTAELTTAVDNGDGTTTETFADGTKQIVDSLNGTILSQTVPSTTEPTTTAVVIGVDPTTNQASVIDTNGNVTTITADNVNNGDVVNLDTNNTVIASSPGTTGTDLGQLASVDTTDTTTDTQLPNTVTLSGLDTVNTDTNTAVDLTPEEQYNKLMQESGMDSATASELSGYFPSTTEDQSTLDTVAQTNQTAMDVAQTTGDQGLIDAVNNGNTDVINALATGDVTTAQNIVSTDTTTGGALDTVVNTTPTNQATSTDIVAEGVYPDQGSVTGYSDINGSMVTANGTAVTVDNAGNVVDENGTVISEATPYTPTVADTNTTTDEKGNLVTTNQLTGEVTTNLPTADTGTSGTNIPINVNVAPLLQGTSGASGASGATRIPTATSGFSGTSGAPAFTGLSTLDFTPHVTKGHQIQLVGQPTFSNTMISPNQTYEQSMPEIKEGGHIEYYAAGGGTNVSGYSGIPTPVSGVTQGSHISLVGQPKFVDQLITPDQYTFHPLSEISHAAEGGLMGYAEGSSITRGHPQFLQPFTSNIHRPSIGLKNFQGHSEGGEIEGHDPEFYSEGGLNSIKHTYVKGDGDGTSDSIPAMLANGEFVIPADVVSGLGNGSNDAGAKVLDEFLKVIRHHKRKADVNHLPPDSKGALGYLLEAKKKAKVK